MKVLLVIFLTFFLIRVEIVLLNGDILFPAGDPLPGTADGVPLLEVEADGLVGEELLGGGLREVDYILEGIRGDLQRLLSQQHLVLRAQFLEGLGLFGRQETELVQVELGPLQVLQVGQVVGERLV